MGTTLNRTAYEGLIQEDLAWLERQPRTLEREHVMDIVRQSADREYGRTPFSGASNSPVLDFNRWLVDYLRIFGRKLTHDEYSIAMAAFYAAHPGEGPKSHVMSEAEANDSGFYVEPYGKGFLLADYRNDANIRYCGQDRLWRTQPIVPDPFPTKEAALEVASKTF